MFDFSICMAKTINRMYGQETDKMEIFGIILGYLVGLVTPGIVLHEPSIEIKIIIFQEMKL